MTAHLKNRLSLQAALQSQQSLLGVLQTMASLPFLLFTVTIIKIDWTMRVKAFLDDQALIT